MRRNLCLTFIVTYTALSILAIADVPRLITYQGWLTDNAGTPVADGNYSFQFQIYDAASGGNVKWNSGTRPVSVSDGLFTHILGDSVPLPHTLFGNDTALWLGVTVGANPEFTPRTRLTSFGYAHQALRADTALYALNTIGGSYLPLSGGTMTGPITNTGNPSITMGKGNFGTGNTNVGLNAFVAGLDNAASGFSSSIGGGANNLATDSASTVAGGRYNRARGWYSTVGGGGGQIEADSNSASAFWSTVAGGSRNYASGSVSFVGGGSVNSASGAHSTVAGGFLNSAIGPRSFVGGGSYNIGRGQYSTVGGGGGSIAADSNSAFGDWSTVSGGKANVASNENATVSGGLDNHASGFFSTISGGALSSASGSFSAIGGGQSHISIGQWSTIGGGLGNFSNDTATTVAGGRNNRARGIYSVVGGGGGSTLADSNSASGGWSTVSGGKSNMAFFSYSTIGGGNGNLASGSYTTVAGGQSNSAIIGGSTVGGGYQNSASESGATVAGGTNNEAAGLGSTIAGGVGDSAFGVYSTIGGGIGNNATAEAATIGGGSYNDASGTGSVVPGGAANVAAGLTSFAAGLRAKAFHDGTFVWGDYTLADFASTQPNQFLIRASGGVGIGTNAPLGKLHVANSTWNTAPVRISGLTGSSVGPTLEMDATNGTSGKSYSIISTSTAAGAGAGKFAIYYNSSPNSDYRFVIDSAGRVGIGTTDPSQELHIASAFSNAGIYLDQSGTTDWRVLNNGGVFAIQSTTFPGPATTQRFNINSTGNTFLVPAGGNVGIGANPASNRLDVEASGAVVADFNRTTNDGVIINLQQAGATEGTISVAGNTVSYNAFTGSHYGWTDEEVSRGELVSLSGDNQNHHGKPESEIIYGIKKSTLPNDPACLGSYLALSEPNHPYSPENPHLVMAVGNGDMWVTDESGDIKPGDYLMSSSTPGHAMKDDEEKYPIGHIVARAAESVDWSSVAETIDGRKHKKISVLFGNFVRSANTKNLEARLAILEAALLQLRTEK